MHYHNHWFDNELNYAQAASTLPSAMRFSVASYYSENASKYANTLANLEEIYGRLQVLESRNERILSENISLNQKYNSSSRLPSYAKIYGLSPSVIRFEVDTNSEAIALINKHATIFADKSKMVPATFHDSFQKFIETFKEEN
ncbi:hypothetical protein DTO169E5_3321 [Paecilomyces variotii]|nr:hypothetical protein DTO169E5_3321 [Paecilomyces variotii]